MAGSSEQQEFVYLVNKTQSGLMRFILPMVPCYSDALDVFQETVSQLWQKFDQYDRNYPFEPWARTFAYMQVLSFRKTHQRRHAKLICLDERVIEQLSTEQALQADVQQLRSSALKTCLKKLKPEEAVLLSQRYGGDTSIREAAQRDGVLENTLYRRLYDIRSRLRKCIESTIAAMEA